MNFLLAIVVIAVLYFLAWKAAPRFVHDDDMDLLDHAILTFVLLAGAAFVVVLTTGAVVGLAYVFGGHP